MRMQNIENHADFNIEFNINKSKIRITNSARIKQFSLLTIILLIYGYILYFIL